MLEKGISFRNDQQAGDTDIKSTDGDNSIRYELLNRMGNIKKAIDHITECIDDEGYTRAATDYTWYKLMWFRDSSMISSSLSQAARVLRPINDKNLTTYEQKAKDGALRILNKEWSVLSNYSKRLENTINIDLNHNEFKKLKNHIPARISSDGLLANTHIDQMHISDIYEHENPNSWLKQFDSVPLILYATSEFIKSFGTEAVPEKIKAIISDNLVDSPLKSFKYM